MSISRLWGRLEFNKFKESAKFAVEPLDIGAPDNRSVGVGEGARKASKTS
jgi:hypothetical protein